VNPGDTVLVLSSPTMIGEIVSMDDDFFVVSIPTIGILDLTRDQIDPMDLIDNDDEPSWVSEAATHGGPWPYWGPHPRKK